MSTGWIVTIVILVVMIGIAVALYFLGKRAQKKQAEQQEQIEAAAQVVQMLIIDKKKMRLNQAGLPEAVMQQTPKLMRRSKVPVVKAKVGPQVMSFIADAAVFDEIPVKKEVKATVSGIYISKVRGVRGSISKGAEPVKKSRLQKFKETLQEKAGAAPKK
jgi:type II secretory pathway pseudopilin PulG